MTKKPDFPVHAIKVGGPADPYYHQFGSRGVKVGLSLFSVLILLFSGLGYFTIGRLSSGMATTGNLTLSMESDRDSTDGAIDILLVGTDSRVDAQGNSLTDSELARLHAGMDGGELNTDTIMLIRVPTNGASATAVSIPRDTYVTDSAYGNMKINAVYANHKVARQSELRDQGVDDERFLENESTSAGRRGLLQAIADLTGTRVDHYAEIGLFGFVLLTDAVGGVDVCLLDDVDDEYSGARFTAGVHSLDGATALSFVRQRYGLPRGDLDRIVRQQAFVASLVRKVLEAGTLTNPIRLAEMSNAVERSVVIDDDWDLLSFANQMTDLAGGNVTFSTIPVTSMDGVGDYGESVVTVDIPQVQEFMIGLLNEGDEAQEVDLGPAPVHQDDFPHVPTHDDFPHVPTHDDFPHVPTHMDDLPLLDTHFSPELDAGGAGPQCVN